MRVVPVIDLKHGTAVHAVAGPRHRYQPLSSVLAASAQPEEVARGLHSRLGLTELYVADLDAIETGRPPHPIIRSLAGAARVMLDAGTGNADRASGLLHLGADAVIVGTETLHSVAALPHIRQRLGGVEVILSIDLRHSRVLSRAGELCGLSAEDALAALLSDDLHQAIVLDLAKVGTGCGPDIALVSELHRRFPGVELLAGGGIRTVEDLQALRCAGAAGALVGTALHRGAITRSDLRELVDVAD